MSTWMYASINRSLTVKDLSKFAHNSRNHVTFSIQSDDGTVSLTRWYLLAVLSDVDAPITGLPQPRGLDNLQQSGEQNMRKASRWGTKTLHPCLYSQKDKTWGELHSVGLRRNTHVSNKTPNKHTQNQSIYRNLGWFCSVSYPISLPVFYLSWS